MILILGQFSMYFVVGILGYNIFLTLILAWKYWTIYTDLWIQYS